MLVKYTYFSGASGKIAGSVASRNRAGDYMRRWVKPTNPQSPSQGTVRAALADAASLWSTLSPSTRTAWDDYATAVAAYNTFGDVRHLTGFQMFVRSLSFRRQVDPGNVTWDSETPEANNKSSLTIPAVTLRDGTDVLTVPYNDEDEWCVADGGFLGIWVSATRSPTQTYPRGPYTLIGVVEGDTASPPAGPFTAVLPNVGFGSLVTVRLRALTADNRLTSQLQITVAAT